MTYLANLIFPPRIAMGAQRKAGWRTTIGTTFSGYEQRNQDWSKARHSFDLSFAVRNAVDYRVVDTHFHEARAQLHTFPFKDFLDFRVEASNGVLLDDDDSPAGLRLAKRYGVTNPYVRAITRPKQGTVVVYRDGTPVSATIDYTTGVVSAIGGSGGVLSWSGQFWVPCRYGVDELPAAAIDRKAGPDGELLVRCDSIPVLEVRE